MNLGYIKSQRMILENDKRKALRYKVELSSLNANVLERLEASCRFCEFEHEAQIIRDRNGLILRVKFSFLYPLDNKHKVINLPDSDTVKKMNEFSLTNY